MRRTLWTALTLILIGVLLLGCGGSKGGEETSTGEEEQSGSDLPVKAAGEPFDIGEEGLVTLYREQPAEIIVQRDSGETVFAFLMKKGGTADDEVRVAVKTFEPELSEEVTESYIPVGQYALQMHAVDETGHGFMLRPKIEFHFTEQEIEQAVANGAALDPLKGNLLILYKEQRSPRWVPQRSVSLDEANGVLTVSNIAGTGSWWLVANAAK